MRSTTCLIRPLDSDQSQSARWNPYRAATMKGIRHPVSRIYFHTSTHTAELMGSERGWLRTIAANAAQPWWGLDGIDPLDRALDIANMIVPGREGQYVLDIANATMIHDRDRHRSGDNDATRVKDYADPIRNVHYDPTTRNALVDTLRTCLRVTNLPLKVGDHVVYSANAELNTAIATGNDQVCLAAKIHGWCEIHPWFEEDDRSWFADVIECAIADGLYREDIWTTGILGNPSERQRVRQGWGDVVTLLRDTTTHPGEVVLSYSVCDGFPDPEVSTSMPPWPTGVPQDWDALTPDQQKERTDARRLWYDLEPDQRWETAIAGLRYLRPWANITPENLATATFGPDVNLFDVFHPDRVERVRVAFEVDAQTEAEEEERHATQTA